MSHPHCVWGGEVGGGEGGALLRSAPQSFAGHPLSPVGAQSGKRTCLPAGRKGLARPAPAPAAVSACPAKLPQERSGVTICNCSFAAFALLQKATYRVLIVVVFARNSTECHSSSLDFLEVLLSQTSDVRCLLLAISEQVSALLL